ncbi:MAG TPA: LytTR family DNA-binding domain-containing protein [Flavisolibacter sp.]|nr:LytTR family DNA-binding domain-containing protein [Flavisolibacter sp.]
MLTAIILENDSKSRLQLYNILRAHCNQIRVEAIVATTEHALQAIEDYQPDILFAEIQLKDETCFELFKKLEQFTFSIIFTSSCETISLNVSKIINDLKSFPLVFLKKPIEVEDLISAIKELEKIKKHTPERNGFNAQKNFLNANYWEARIAIPYGGSFHIIKVSDIIYLEAQGAYTHFVLKQGKKKTASKNIKEFEEMLGEYNFFRIHKSYMINLAELDKYDRCEVLMSNDVLLDISRRRLDDFIQLLKRLGLI